MTDIQPLPYMDIKLDIEDRIKDLLGRLSLAEKFRLLSGHKMWTTRKIKRLKIPELGTTDGPNGCAFHSTYKRNTLFPTSICLAATWNRELPLKYGEVIGLETRASGRHMILAPGINIDRSPLNGRTFEYLTEDPFLNKEMATPYVKGVQSKRISACVKHYAANNQETKRFTVSSEVGERALEEIYLRSFKAVVQNADPWCVMACYNKVNAIYGCENKFLLRDTLMDKWGFTGFVCSDWFATRKIVGSSGCVKAGLSLEMPHTMRYKIKNLQTEFDQGKFTEQDIDFLVTRLLRTMFRVGLFDPKEHLPKGSRNLKEHWELSQKIAEEGIVLLKNDKNILPLDPSKTKAICVLGPNAKKAMGKPFYGGSSAVWPKHEVTPYKGIERKIKGRVVLTDDMTAADAVILIMGLNHSGHKDAEGSDRQRLELPQQQVQLIKETAAKNQNTIVVLVNGSPIAMSEWIQDVPAVVESWYGGMEGGTALANVLFGDVNPSGKLPITFPEKISDSPAHVSERTFPGVDLKVYYDEGIYVGYRHFDKKDIKPLFPFGFGLSYTTYEYSNLKVDKNRFSGTNKINLTVDVTNTGSRSGSEVVQLYIRDVECSADRPIKELQGFNKIFLKSKEKGTVSFTIDKSNLEFYDEKEHVWKAEPGKFEILIGSSSRDIKLQTTIEYQ